MCNHAYDLSYVALRYFNVAGAQLDRTIFKNYNAGKLLNSYHAANGQEK